MPELRVRGDRQYLVQMVSNLIENAIKYGGPGKTVCVKTSSGDTSNRPAAIIEVSDNGPGIPPGQLEHVFDRFYRADSARSVEVDEDSGSPTGSGLGLSIVAGIAKIHGGTVNVASEPQKGSTFEVNLPLLPEKASAR